MVRAAMDDRRRATPLRRTTAALIVAALATVVSSTASPATAHPAGATDPASAVRIVDPSVERASLVRPTTPTAASALAGAPLSSATGATGAGGPVLTPALRRALQTRLTSLRKKYAYPGVSVAIIFPDGSTWAGTSGLADVEAGTPVTPATAFAIASVSKTFTAALVMALVQDGKIGLDTPVTRYLPELKVPAGVTVRQLLDHTSGLRDFFFGRGVDAALLKDPSRHWETADALAFVGKPYFKPGRGWHYSNTNYVILGMLAERVGRAPLGEQLRNRFFDPLGLIHTTYQPDEAPRGPVAHGYRFPSASVDSVAVDLSDGTPVVPFTSVVTAAGGAGGIAASATDIARWARALFDGDALAEATVRTMVGDVASTAHYRPTIPYGLGVQGVDIVGHRALGHSGRLLGFRSLVRWLPDDGLAIAVLTNQSRTDPGIIARSLLKLALRSAPTCACAGIR
jgi:CubicO group peptidase (beta-lactamase class C family)